MSEVAESPSTSSASSNGEAKPSLPSSSSSSKLFALLKSKRDDPPASSSPPTSSSSPSSTPPQTSSSSSPTSGDSLAKLAFWKKKPTSSSSSSSSSTSFPSNPTTPKGIRSASFTSLPSVLPNVSSMAMAAATGGGKEAEGGGQSEASSPTKNGKPSPAASPPAVRPASPPVEEEVASLALSPPAVEEGASPTLAPLLASASFPPPADSASPALSASSPAKPAAYKSSASYYSSLGGSSSLAAFRQSLTLGKSPSFNNSATSSPAPPVDPAPPASEPASAVVSAVSSPGVSGTSSPVTSPLSPPRRIARQPSLDSLLTSLSPPPPPPSHHHSSTSSSPTTSSSKESKRLSNFIRLLQDEHLSLDALRKLAWQGVPVSLRSLVWKLLLEYVPSQKKRREAVLENRRMEYVGYLAAYDRACKDGSKTEEDIAVLRQIRADIPRTSPGVRFFQQVDVQQSLERVLYVFAIRHPASGYVQGMNDLVTPFYAVFLRDWVADVDVGRVEHDVSVSEDAMYALEADAYWCLSKLLDGIQDHYTFAQPGIQRQIFRMREVADRVDSALVKHLDTQQVQLLHFAFPLV